MSISKFIPYFFGWILAFCCNNVVGQVRPNNGGGGGGTNTCKITGTTSVTGGTTQTYLLSCQNAIGSNDLWTVSGGTIVDNRATAIDIQWNNDGTRTGNIYCTASDGTPASLVVTITPTSLYPGTASGSQAINYNTVPAALSCTPAVGGACSGAYTYQWQQSSDNVNFKDTSGITGLTFSPGALTATTYYRVKAVCAGATVFTNVVTVTVYPPLQIGTLSPASQTINYNTIPPASLSLSSVTGGNGVYSYQWLSSPTLNGQYLPAATGGSSYNPGQMTGTTYFEVIVSSSNGMSATSGPVVINVNPQVIPGLINPASITIASGTNPGPLVATPASGGACGGSYRYQWQSSTDGVNWNSIPNVQGLIYSPGPLTVPMYYRLQVICGTDTEYSNVAVIAVGSVNASMNYIRERTLSLAGITDTVAANALTNPTDVHQVTRYLDGLGRPIQTVAKQASPLQNDLVAFDVYDPFGRETTKYLPYTAPSNDGNYKANFMAEQNSFNAAQYPNENFFYSQAVFESSPLNRIQKTFAPGVSWAGSAGSGAENCIQQQYLLNTGADSVRIWTIAHTPGSIPVTTATYGTGQLFKDIVTDEAGHRAVRYRNMLGQTVLNKVQVAGTPGTGHMGWQCTYYVYDDLGNLRFVIPPKAVEWLLPGGWAFSNAGGGQVAAELCFRYEYDYRKRMIIKKVPGAGEVWMVYDNRDRLVFSQDANLRATQQWLTNLYDGLNRPDTTGLMTWSGSRDQLQVAVSGTASYTSPSDLDLHVLNMTGDWTATNSVTLDNGFSTLDGGEFKGSIVSNGTGVGGGGATVSGSPIPAGASFAVLTVTYYDNYNWVSQANAALGSSGTLTAALDNSNTGKATYFNTSYNTAPTYAVPITQNPVARGQVTGTMALVLGTSSQYEYGVSFYDDHSRMVQTQSINITGGRDIVTQQYDFRGKLLRSLMQHQKNGTNGQTHTIMTKVSYDPAGRVLAVTKNIDTASTDQTIGVYTYNESGQLQKKSLGNSLDSLVYAYTVRGLLSSINKNYISGSSNNNYFGMELGYDKTASASSATYLRPAFNGNISGTVWKSRGDGIGRKYDFTYDTTGRLTAANFTQNTNGTSWDNNTIDFSVNNLTYDASGNLLTMNQKGYKVGGSSLIDSLSYSYLNGNTSNKLLGVIDAVNDTTARLGDFQYNPATKQSTDYTYDGNGNRVSDNNRAIDNTSYNFLGLPQLIHIRGKGNIQYTYDAAGRKLQKIITDSSAGKVTTITYIGSFVYQNHTTLGGGSGTDTLQFVSLEEGRARWSFHAYTNGTTAYKWEYDFFLRDNQGNTRVVLTQQKDTAKYIATMEAAYRNTENALFYNIPLTSWARKAALNYPQDTTLTNPNDSVAKVNGSGNKVGPAIILKVMSGDNVDIGVNYFYNSKTSTDTSRLSASDLLNTLASGMVSVGGGLHGSFSSLSNPSGPLNPALSNFLQNNNNNSAGNGKPSAYLNWILFDNQFNYVAASSGAKQVGSAGTATGGGLQSPLSMGGIPMTKSGYLYIYVSNATPNWDVFFDNLSVKTYSGPLLEENHYYPFGLSLAGISDKAIKTNYSENKYRYNGGSELQNKEFSDGSGLEIYEAGARSYDQQIGRFHQVDPLADRDLSTSGYAYVGNNPILYNDPTGATRIMQVPPFQGGVGGGGVSWLGGGGDMGGGQTAEQFMAEGPTWVIGNGDGSGPGGDGDNSGAYADFWSQFYKKIYPRLVEMADRDEEGATVNFSMGVNKRGDDIVQMRYNYGTPDNSDPDGTGWLEHVVVKSIALNYFGADAIEHTIIDKASRWEKFFYGSFYEGINVFGERTYMAHYGGVAPAFGIAKVATAVRTIEAAEEEAKALLKTAQELYPNKAGDIELHHTFPKYLGGDIDGELAPLDAAYHQMITNEFRAIWPYGSGKPNVAEVEEIMEKVYSKLPIIK